MTDMSSIEVPPHLEPPPSPAPNPPTATASNSKSKKSKSKSKPSYPKIPALTTPSTIQKRPTHKSINPSPNYFYITRTSSYFALLKKCKSWLIHSSHPTINQSKHHYQRNNSASTTTTTSASHKAGLGKDRVTFCAIGAAITKCTTLALQIQTTLGVTSHLVVSTGTVELVDEVIPEDEDMEEFSRVRRNSKIEVMLILGPEPAGSGVGTTDKDDDRKGT